MPLDETLPETLRFDAAETIDLSLLGRVLRVAKGALVLTRADAGSDCVVQTLALPGDLLGMECLGTRTASLQALALSAGALEPVALERPGALTDLLAEAYDQACRQCRDMMALRSGPVGERLRQLLVLLGAQTGTNRAGGDIADLSRPPLRTLAALVDATPESVCRVLSRLRKLKMLQPVTPQRARVSLQALSEFQPPRGMTESSLARINELQASAV